MLVCANHCIVALQIVFDATNPVSEYPNLEVRWDGSESAGVFVV
jgi:hypothetical protein